MNKKKSDPKKFLVRNTVLPLPKTKVEEKAKKVDRKITEKVTDFRNFPRSDLLINKTVDKVVKSKPQQKDNVAFCEKVTRKINFPPDKAIFKDLIPLDVPAKPPPILASRDPLPQKDKEPILSDYVQAKTSKEFIYHPSFKIENQSVPNQVNNLHLYKILQRNY